MAKSVEDQVQDNAAKLASKILLVMSNVESVVKDKTNDFHKYKYASDAAIITAVRVAMIKHKLVALPSQISCLREGDMTTVCVDYTLIDAETGYSTVCRVHGQGQDKGDKGAYKAATGAEKYFFLKAFMIPTEDDPENEGPAQRPQQAKPAPARQAAPPARQTAPAQAKPVFSEEDQAKAQELIEAIIEKASFPELQAFGLTIKPTIEKLPADLQEKVRAVYLAEITKFRKLQK